MSASTDTSGERLLLLSSLDQLEKVPAWIESLGSRYPIPENIRFAMDLCLEEILANIIRHGYESDPGHSIEVEFLSTRTGQFVLVVEDEGIPFDPLAVQEPPALDASQTERVGGLGIRLLRQFTDTLEYSKTERGNRLRIGFSSGS